MNLPNILDAEQARIVTLSIAALAKLEKLQNDLRPGPDAGEQEDRCLDLIREQMDALDDEQQFASLLRALVEAWHDANGRRISHYAALAAIWAVRPENWNDRDDLDQAWAWALVREQVEGASA